MCFCFAGFPHVKNHAKDKKNIPNCKADRFFFINLRQYYSQILKHDLNIIKDMANLVSKLKNILLFEDSVTIPGFGTFETMYQSAQLDEKTGVIHPPTKSVKLNPQKKEDPENRLAKAAGLAGITESELGPMVEEFVKTVKAKLDAKSSLEIDEVGTIYCDEQNNLALRPVASKLSIDNYGLDTEEIEPVAPADRVEAPVMAAAASTSRGKTLQTSDPKTTTKVSTTKTTTTKTTTKKTEEKKDGGILKPLIITLVIVALLAILFVIFKDQIMGFVNGDDSDADVPYQEQTVEEPEVTTVAEDPDAILAGVGFADVRPQNLGSKYKKYYLIGGAFRDKANATKEMEKLGATEVLHVDGTEYYRVAFIGSDSAQEIVDAYNQAIARGIKAKDIWLLKNSQED